MKPNREQELIIACVAGKNGQEADNAIRKHCSRELNWSAFIQEALEQGVLPLVYHRLTSVCPDITPAIYLEQLRRHYQLNALRNFLLSQEMIRLINLFEKKTIAVIPLKGPFWSEILFGNLALRQCTDIDLVIQSKDVETAAKILVFLGYQPDPKHQLNWEAHYYKPGTPYVVDLHWGFSNLSLRKTRDATFRFDVNAMWRRLEKAKFLNEKMNHFQAEDMLMIACQDSVKEFWKNKWPQLKWIYDVSRIVELHPKMDWDRINIKAGRLGYQRLLYLSLGLAKRIFDTQLPQPIVQRIDADRMAMILIDEATKRLWKRHSIPNPYKGNQWQFIARHRFCIRLKERRQDQVAQVLEIGHMALDRFRNIAATRNPNLLPKGLHFLYPLNLLIYHMMRPLWHIVGPHNHNTFRKPSIS